MLKQAVLTGAILKCYTDKGCTNEIEKEASSYLYRLGPESGFNGTDGDYLTQRIYIKNVGNSNAYNVIIKEVGDTTNFFKMSTSLSSIENTVLNVGTIKPYAAVEIVFYSIIPKKTSAIESNINYVITYETVPDESEITCYKDAKENDRLVICSVSTDRGNFEEFTIQNIGQSNEIEMSTPVEVVYGTVEEIIWDPGTTKYKVRYKCFNCGTWSDWYNLDEVDKTTGIICQNCSLPVKTANNVIESTVTEEKDSLNKYRINIKEEDWLGPNPDTGTYYLKVDNPGVILGSYKKVNRDYISNLINISYHENESILESLEPFTGYIILIREDILKSLHSQAGKAFGYGPYGEPLYGQEGLLHITDKVSMEVPIKGEKVTNIVASYGILAKYDGTEMNIEDIQSWYTERYHMLGCYDGPALPLILKEEV